MTFQRITEHQRTLRARISKLDKEAGVGKAMYRSSKRLGGPVLGPLMFGAGVLGLAGVASHGLGKAREYKRGFDPRIQEAKLQGQRF